ncbi:helix-turn-helix domain-containing protein [Jeongeupia naejangsanensis]|uniref:Helix-turn-helix transcriptional regulator n=1 Tax=Jeongeupia naejangsanensis TaxID=613195 RepID=A0ABS2BLD3_9NEIS|nr:helix-turn-helix transcriptional regulator [Jeongeupia naejangsanensis]MBM3116418.1 helix-turn-helix transcriptional regulator [Jeongeupia naejangsanensis]
MTSNISIIGKRLKEARVHAGLSQERLGILAGIDEFSASARMNQYERGKHEPGMEIMKRIAEKLHRPISYFYEVDDDLAHLIEIYGGLDQQRKEKLLAIAVELHGNQSE